MMCLRKTKNQDLIQYRINVIKMRALVSALVRRSGLVALAFGRLRLARDDNVGDEDKKMLDVNVWKLLNRMQLNRSKGEFVFARSTLKYMKEFTRRRSS
jgi:hypothetical protein